MGREALAIHGHVQLEVIRPDGSVERTEGSNTVVDGGRQLVAQLLSGTASSPIFSIVAGVSDKETVSDLTKMIEPDGIEPVPIPMEDVKVKNGIITLKASFPAADKERLIKEAGLMISAKAGDSELSTLYNRALVKPNQTVRVKEVLTLTWTLAFAPPGAI